MALGASGAQVLGAPTSRLAERLRLLQPGENLRGEIVFLPTPVGRVEVTLLTSQAQLQLGLLEEPLDEAVLAFAPAGVFSRKEPSPGGRVVVSLPVARF
jgi:hypothetical protein